MATDIYHKVGSNLNSSFVYTDATNTPVTGKVQGNFTLQLEKNGVGNQSTAGITITEISAANNPGEYAVAISGSSGFTSATGSYDLVIFDTASSTNRWVLTVRVTSDGTGAGSWGDASFTAAASNARVMSGGSPLTGATIRILSGSVLYVQTTTDSNGLWGPVYFNTNGTYTIQVQKSGYTLGSSSLTVSGSAATGPGVDISVTAASAATSVTATSLWQYAKRMMKDASGVKADQEAKEVVDDALTMIATSRKWPYLETVAQVQLNASYTTGTVAVTNGLATVTLTGGVFPTWAASGSFYGPGGLEMPILTRDSNTQITLKSAWSETTNAAAAYTLGRHSYPLPADLLMLETVTWGSGWPYGTDPVSYATLTVNKAFWQTGTSRPWQYAIGNNQLMVWPMPNESHLGNLTYFRKPASLVNPSDTMDFDILLLEVVRRAIDYQVSIRRDCVAGSRQETLGTYEEAWSRAANNDKTSTIRGINSVSQYDPNRPLRSPTILG